MSLSLIHQVSKLLNSDSDLVRSLNSVLVMLMDYLPIRNPVILLRDSVYQHYYLDVAPELSEAQKNQWNRMMEEAQKTKPLKLQHQMMFYPGDEKLLQLPAPEGYQQERFFTMMQPVVFKQQNLPLCVLVLHFSQSERVQEVQKLLPILADLMALAMVARGVATEEIQEALQERVEVPTVLGSIVGESQKLQQLAEVIKKVASSKATVLIQGESGTGKELFAKSLHMHSIHKKAPFIGVNCAALSDNLLESELFGHEKGAYTGATTQRKGRFELADGGTLFLDEIGDTSLSFQTKILRVLQEGTFERLGSNQTIHVDVRVVCATNVNLEDAIRKGTFREDLFYRLNVIRLWIPPLRERKEDIAHLVRYFLNGFNQKDKANVTIHEEDLDYLSQLDWYGNVRELENYVHSGFLMEQDGFFHCERSQPTPSLKPMDTGAHNIGVGIGMPAGSSAAGSAGGSAKTDLAVEEATQIQAALKEFKGIQTKAADSLGITLRQLRYRIKKYNLVVRKIQ